MEIKDKIYIDLFEEPVSGDVFPMMTYDNPEYYQKINMGLPVWGIPKQILTYTLKGAKLEIFRGEALKVKPFIGHLPYNFIHPDHPINLQYINNDFDLDRHQQGAVEAMKSKRQGIIHATTSAGKSLLLMNAIVQMKQKTLIIVHRRMLMDQLLEDIDKYIRDENGKKITPGIIGGGKFSIGDITIGIDKSISKRIEDVREEFGMVILDECHICPAKTISDIVNSVNAKYRFGLSGTLKRKDQKEFLIFSIFGEVIYTIGKDILQQEGRVVPVHVKILESNTQFDWNGVVAALTEQQNKNPIQMAGTMREKTISLDPIRNDMILNHVASLPGKTIVLSRYVDPCFKLSEMLSTRFGMESGVITGKDPKKALEAFQAMKHGDLKTIFATIGCVSTGVSISDLNNIVLISPVYTNELLLHQIRGRLMRTAEGKTHGDLWFVWDQYIYNKAKLNKFKRIMEE